MAITDPSASLLEMSRLVYSSSNPKEFNNHDSASADFGIVGRANSEEQFRLLRLMESTSNFREGKPGLPQAHGMERMFQTVLGNQAASIIGNEERTLSAIRHVSNELVVQTLKLTGQLQATDRVLLTTLPDADEGDDRPATIVLTNEIDYGSYGYLKLFSEELTLSTITRAIEISDYLSAPDSRDTPEYQVFIQLLGSAMSVAELLYISRPELIYMQMPRMVNISAPAPAIRVDQGNMFSSMGIVCVDHTGQIGVSACLHGTGEEGAEVQILNRTCVISKHNHVNDIVFIPIDDELLSSIRISLKGHAGLRAERDKAPALHENFVFDGITNPSTNTYAQSCDPWLFTLNPTKQLRIQTTRDTDEGDSGCTLIDQDDKITAFAFQMTEYGQRPAFTDWIWAPNALAALSLSPWQP